MKPFRFGIAIAATEPPEVFIETVKLAEQLGFDSIWVPDFRLYLDLYVALGLAALNTTHVRLGSAVTNPYTRHPGMTAVGISSVDQLSGGRAVLGLGSGGIVMGLLDIERHKPILTCRRAIEEIRSHLSDNSSHDKGKSRKYVRLDLPTRPDLPIVLGATGHQMLALAGEIADGVIVNVGADQSCLEGALNAVNKGVERANRPSESLERFCWLQGTAVSEDESEAINLVKPAVALTLGRMPKWTLEAMEMDEEEIRQIQRVYREEGAEFAAKRVTDDMVKRFTIAGTPQRAIGELERLQELGFDEFIFIVEEFGGNVRSAIKSLADRVLMGLK